jgi:hypothetical protein
VARRRLRLRLLRFLNRTKRNNNNDNINNISSNNNHIRRALLVLPVLVLHNNIPQRLWRPCFPQHLIPVVRMTPRRCWRAGEPW